MKEIKFKYKQNPVQLWLLKVALFFSVFAFSGFNEMIQYSFQESERSELVESRILQPVFTLNNSTTNYLAIPLSSFQFDINPYSSYALLHFKLYIAVKYKTALKKNLTYDFSEIKLIIKLIYSSSPDEFLPFSMKLFKNVV